MKLTKSIARKVLATVNVGLCRGQGKPEPGKMCVEAAVCYALGLPHGDKPPCVGSAVRAFKIELNDSWWSSDAARARGMRKIAVAQLGSDTIDQKKFSELLALKTIQQLCPKLFRLLGEEATNAKDKAAMEEAAVVCEGAKNLGSVLEGLKKALARALALALADAHARAHALALALARALALAHADARAHARARDEALTLLADICLECLIELKSPGCKWLDLCEPEGAA